MTPSTITAKKADADKSRVWFVVDATDKPLGRLASEIARILRGKHKPSFTPHIDTGDFVIVVNASKVKVTGDMVAKKYYRHSMYPGGLKTISQEKLLATKPERVVQYAIKGMLPHNAHGARLLKHLKVYAGPDHPHQSQVNAGKGKGHEVKA
jgi:large subunit ribosomal protein L13